MSVTEPHLTLSAGQFVQPLIVFLVWSGLASLLAEPSRRTSQAIIVAVAAGAYMNGGFGGWELLFTVVVAVCAWRGLASYRWIAVAWLLHTGWDVLHHLAGKPMIAWLPDSSFNCAVTDAALAAWFLCGAPSVWRLAKRGAAARRVPSA